MLTFTNDASLTYYREVEAFATKTGQLASLRRAMAFLHTYGENGDPRFPADVDPLSYPGTEHSEARLFKDFSPYSFEFMVLVRRDGAMQPSFSGGAIYHGPHDGYGSGEAPTFSVTLEPTSGWSIHT